MSVRYAAVGWNRQKKIYDRIIAATIVTYLALFIGVSAALFPTATAETLFIRATGTAAIILLHVILSIGPLCRLDARYLPLLYNRRHLGVVMFFLALIHGVVSLIQFHALGDVNPLVSLFFGQTDYDTFVDFPFQMLGFFALLILSLMAITSHDFWLKLLTPPLWKALHMLVYFAYALIVMHVALGILQDARNPAFAVLTGLGLAWIIGVHVFAALRPNPANPAPVATRELSEDDAVPPGYTYAAHIDDIAYNRAKTVRIGAERIAVFRVAGDARSENVAYAAPAGDNIYAISAVCRHQNGPLGEGRIIDGCVTCPWHGFQYDPATGKSPPPYTEQVACFPVFVTAKREIFIQGKAQ